MEIGYMIQESLSFRPGLPNGLLIGLGALLVIALLYCVYSDLWMWETDPETGERRRARVIPNWITLPGIVLGAVLAPVLFVDWKLHLGAGLISALVFGAMAFVKIRGNYGFGMGDAKLYAMLGFIFGFGIIPIALIASLSGLVVGVAVIVLQRKGVLGHYIPHGPQIVLGALVVLAGNLL